MRNATVPYEKRRPARLTVAFTSEMVAATDEAVRTGAAATRNELIERAVRRELARIDREAVDRAFYELAEDAEIGTLEREVVAEAEQSGWEALQLAEANQAR